MQVKAVRLVNVCGEHMSHMKFNTHGVSQLIVCTASETMSYFVHRIFIKYSKNISTDVLVWLSDCIGNNYRVRDGNNVTQLHVGTCRD